MKKCILLILTFAYLATSSGASVYIQQCMGKTIAWSLLDKEANKCEKCGMHKNASNDCCSSHIKVLKIHNDQNIPEGLTQKVFLSSAALPTFHFSVLNPKLESPSKNKDLFTAFRSTVNLHILYCTFLI